MASLFVPTKIQLKAGSILDAAYQGYGPDLIASIGEENLDREDFVSLAYDTDDEGFQDIWDSLTEKEQAEVLASFWL